MQVGTGKSVLNGIAIGKLKIYKKKDTAISAAEVADTAAEVARFEEAQQKAIEQQTALYEKALAEAGEDIAEVFNIHAMMLEDDDFVDAIKEIINSQKKCAEYAVKTAGNNQAAVFAAMDDPYLQARSADVIDIAQAILDILQGVDNASLQGTEPSILVAEDLAPSETVRMDKSLLLGFITREGSSNSHTAILARSMNIPALIQCKDIQDDWDGKMAVIDGYNACVYVEPTPDLLKSLKKRQQEDQKKQALLQELKGLLFLVLLLALFQALEQIGGGVHIHTGIVAVHHGHLAVPVILDILALDQGRDVHAAGQNGGVAVGAALAGDEAQQQALVHAHRLGRGQILGHQNAGLGALQAGIVHPLQDVQDRLCNVDDVRTAGLQIRVIHGCEHGSLIVAGGLDSVLGALVLAVDDLLDGVHKVVIFQHHGVDVEHFSNVLACFGQCLFVQSSLLLNGFLLGSLKAGHLCSGVGDLCGGDHGVLFLIDLQLADGNAVQNASTGAYLHRSFSFLLIHFKKAPADHSARAVASRRDQTFSVRNF